MALKSCGHLKALLIVRSSGIIALVNKKNARFLMKDTSISTIS
jgi:hypothetical protein